MQEVKELKIKKKTYTRDGEKKSKLIIHFKNRTIEVNDSKVEEVLSPFVEGAIVYKHTITVKCFRETTFNFYGSVYEYEQGIRYYDHDRLLEAFEAIISDALAWYDYQDIDEFAKAFGYSSIKACIKAHRACYNAFKKFQRILGLNVRDTAEFLAELQNAIIDYLNSL